MKAATQRIPGSVHKYVTGVSEESQRTGNLKYDGYKAVEHQWQVHQHHHQRRHKVVFIVAVLGKKTASAEIPSTSV